MASFTQKNTPFNPSGGTRQNPMDESPGTLFASVCTWLLSCAELLIHIDVQDVMLMFNKMTIIKTMLSLNLKQKSQFLHKNKGSQFRSIKFLLCSIASFAPLFMAAWSLGGCFESEKNDDDRRRQNARTEEQRDDRDRYRDRDRDTSSTRSNQNQRQDNTWRDRSDSPPQSDYEIDDRGLQPIDYQGAIGGNRPVTVRTPLGFNSQGTRNYPLLILLHGFASDAESQDRYLGLSRLALDRGYIFAAPNGTPIAGNVGRFWNATEACCNFANTRVDDIAYIRDLIRQIIARFPVDPKRVYLFGHSNGAFMAHRLACEEAPRIAAIAALAGGLRTRLEDCKPRVPVNVLTIHGTNDATIRYEGGRVFPTSPTYPSAMDTITHWAKVNGCESSPRNENRLSIVRSSRSNETLPLVFESCTANVKTEHWRIDQGEHVPTFNGEFITRVLDFFEDSRRTP